MNGRERPSGSSTPARPEGCWSRIGVGGDRSCPELAQFVHCRNCPVYSAGAVEALDVELPSDYLDVWTAHFAKGHTEVQPFTQAVVMFRVAAEWFALPAESVTEVTTALPIHTLPHTQNAAILGVVNVRGSLVTCLSLERLLGVETPATHGATAPQRLLVIRWQQSRAVCPVAEVHGIHRFHPRDLRDVPSTVTKATAYSASLLIWRDRAVGVLDVGRLCAAVSRSVA